MASIASCRCVLTLLLALTGSAAAFAPAPTKVGKGDRLPQGAVGRLGTARLRHAGEVFELRFSPDGKSLASGGSDTAVLLWSVPSPK